MYQQEKRNSEAFSLFFRAFLSEDKTLINSVVSRVYAIYKKEKMAKPSLFSEAAFPTTSHFITSYSLDQLTYSTTPQQQWTFTKQT